MNLIKTLGSLLILFLLAQYGHAQLGIKLGVVSAKQSVEYSGIKFVSPGKIGVQAGIDYKIMINENLFIRPGLQFTMKGAGNNDDTDVDEGTFAYIELPVNIEYRLEVGSHHLGLLAGPYIGSLLSATNVDGDDLKEFYTTTEYGYNIGAEFQFNNFAVGVTFSAALSNTYEQNLPDVFIEIDDIEGKNRYSAIYFRYGF